ncbi:MAG TPA: hypothetical protein PLL00_09965 [Bacteroidia bacterium]|nr:hypothetical protein [Bacteroidia bacterium]
MKIKKFCFYSLLLILATIGCSVPDSSQTTKIIDTVHFSEIEPVASGDTILRPGVDADTIYKLILSLPEVAKRARYIHEQTKGERHLQVMIAESPNNVIDYYWVKAGEDSENAYVTHFNFYVFPKKNWEIKYFDTVKDTLITLEDWRKENKKSPQ